VNCNIKWRNILLKKCYSCLLQNNVQCVIVCSYWTRLVISYDLHVGVLCISSCGCVLDTHCCRIVGNVCFLSVVLCVVTITIHCIVLFLVGLMCVSLFVFVCLSACVCLYFLREDEDLRCHWPVLVIWFSRRMNISRDNLWGCRLTKLPKKSWCNCCKTISVVVFVSQFVTWWMHSYVAFCYKRFPSHVAVPILQSVTRVFAHCTCICLPGKCYCVIEVALAWFKEVMIIFISAINIAACCWFLLH